MDDQGGGAAPQQRRRQVDSTTAGVLVALVVVLVVAVIGVVSVRNAQETIRRSIGSGPSAPTDPAGGEPTRDLTDAQRRVVEEIKAQVSAIRGLPWKADLPVRLVTRDALAAKVRELNAKELAEKASELAADEAVLKLLQLIPGDVDLVRTIDSLLAGGVLGFYDDELKELYVGGVDGAMIDPATRSVLAHELTHALTDQHFDFGAAGRRLDDANRTEEAAALAALVEGDAELVTALWEEEHLDRGERAQARAGASNDGGTYANVPPYLLRSLFFPYEDGLAFVRGRYREGGFAAVDRAYRSPPVSTEQILHPELYVAGQGWAPPPFPDVAAASGCGRVDEGNLGEFDMAQVLARHIGQTESRRAAQGWNGDAYSVVRCGATLGFVQRWQTDEPADATRLAEALARWSRGWSGSSRGPDADGRFSGPRGAGRVVLRAPGRLELVLAGDVLTVDRLARVLAAT